MNHLLTLPIEGGPVTPEQLLTYATEFTFRPNYGSLAEEFGDDVEGQDAIVLSWRGRPSERDEDQDRWAITTHTHYCWTNDKGWVWEPSGGNRTKTFMARARFPREEAVRLITTLLAAIEQERIPILQAKVDQWNSKPEEK